MDTFRAVVQPLVEGKGHRCFLWKKLINDPSFHSEQGEKQHRGNIWVCYCAFSEQYYCNRVVFHAVL